MISCMGFIFSLNLTPVERTPERFIMTKSQECSAGLVKLLLLWAIVAVSCEDKAQKRFGFGGKGKEQEQPQGENMPGGFGTYPLWKFHKFDGFSLRPVPMQLDIGYGIPPPPPTYLPPTAYGSGGYGGGQSYAPPPPPPSYPQPTYDSYSPPAPSYSAPPSYSPPSYNSPPPYSPPQSYNAPPQYSPQPYSAPPISMGYQAVQPNSYAPSQPAYLPPQQQFSPPPQYGDMSYSASAPEPSVSGGGSFAPKAPTYTAFETSNGYGNMAELSMPLNPPSGGFVKRYFSAGNSEQEKQQQTQNSEADKSPKTSNTKQQ